jgi:hypothetical protein
MSDNQLPIPDFVDVDANAVAAAEGAANDRGAAGKSWVLPEGVALSKPTGAKNKRYARWNEQVTVSSAYRTVTQKGLIDVVVIVKARTGQPNEENGNAFLHFYINRDVMAGTETDPEKLKKHSGMTKDSLGTLAQLIRLAGFMPKGEAGLKASLLSLMFPAKGEPGAKSRLDGVSVTARLSYSEEPKKVQDEATGEWTNTVDTRLGAEAFLPAETA